MAKAPKRRAVVLPLSSQSPAAKPVVLLGVTDSASHRLLRGHPDHLAKQGWEVHVVSNAPSFPSKDVCHHSIPMKREPAPWADVKSLLGWLRTIRRVRPDVVVVGTPKAGLLGVVASAALRVPVRVYLVRGLRLETTRGPLRTILFLIELFSMRLATHVVSVSNSLRSRLVDLRLVSGRKIRVLGAGSSNGVDVDEFRPPARREREAARADLGIRGDEVAIGYLGRIHPDKGVAWALSVYEGIETDSRAVFVIAGPVEDPALAASIRSKSATESRHRVLLVEAFEEPSRFYHALDLFWLPSRREGFPNVVLEAAAAGVPSFVSDATGCVDAVVDGVTGWLLRLEFPNGAAMKVAEVIDSDTTRAAAGAAARKWVELNFARARVWKNFDLYLAEITSRSPKPVRPR